MAQDSASSTVLKIDARITRINARRAEMVVSHEELCRRAAAGTRNWFRLLRGEQVPTDALVKRLETALTDPKPARPKQIIASYHRLVMILLATEQKFPVEKLMATDFSVQRPQVPDWLIAARIQNMAIYITTVELEVENADFARAVGITRQAVHKARNKVEDLRDDPAIDELLARVTLQVRGVS